MTPATPAASAPSAAPAEPFPAARVAALADRLQALAAQHDADPSFPAPALDLLKAADLHRTFAPRESGGEVFASAEDRALALMDVLRAVGRVDLSLGRLYEGHVNALQLFDWYGRPEQKAWLGDRLSEGALFGVWATEPPPGVRIEDRAAGPVLSGRKSFATGAGGLDYALVTAQDSATERRLVIARADAADRADLSGWTVRGMRATGSGLYCLSGLPAGPEDCLGRPGDYDRDPRFTAGAWRFTAVQLGGVEGLLVHLRDGLSPAARADPLQRARFADAVAAVRSAGFWVRRAALAHARDAEEAVPIARMTRGVVERAGLELMETAARGLGTRSAFDGQPADRMIRDLSLYLRQAQPDQARDEAARAWLERDPFVEDPLW
jgi:alkylation response protein AidB-like acyl-CoA dehydrogenase